MLHTDTFLQPTSPPIAPLPSAPIAVSETVKAQIETVRVLHVINGEHYAGAERVQDLLAKNLPELGYTVGFACVKLDRFGAMRETCDAPLYDVKMHSKFDLWTAIRIARIVQDGNYRLVHGHTARTALLASIVSKMTDVPMVYHAHSPATRNTMHRFTDRMNGLVERLSLRRASRVIAVSQAVADHMIREGYDSKLITVVPNGVPAVSNLFDRSRPEYRWTLGTVALFRPRKGTEVLLDAMAVLRQKGINAHLRAVGAFESKEYAAEIARRIDRLGLGQYVTWTGFTGNVTEELLNMDLFVFPSLFGEGMPMALLESMAAGVPIVATRAPGIPEAIRDGHDGVLAEPDNAEDLARAVSEIIDGRYDWSTLRTNAIAHHAEKFSDRAMAEGVAAVYRDVLKYRSVHERR